ncbi:glycosyl hydrolase [Xylariaceae sp. FL0804]|nr:glycosyl hydrolase [Xylariaceae sp. FL0804]
MYGLLLSALLGFMPAACYALAPGYLTSRAGRHALERRESGSPVLTGYTADPNIVIFGDTYYIYPTTDGFVGWGGKTLYAWSSPDLVTWTRSDEPLLTLNGTSGNVPWSDGNAWAPTIMERDGKYYFYFCGNNPTYDRKTIGVAVGDSPLGPFTAEAEAMILNNEALTTDQAIDPAAFLDPETGTYYLYWGNGGALMAELNDNMTSINWDTALRPEGLTNFTEASFMNYRDGVYHYTYSIGDTDYASYQVGYATGASATGPFTYQGIVLQEDDAQGILGPGSSSVVQIPPDTDEWYVAYHRFAIPDGNGTQRVVCLDHVYFDNDTGIMEPVVLTLTGVDAVTL